MSSISDRRISIRFLLIISASALQIALSAPASAQASSSSSPTGTGWTINNQKGADGLDQGGVSSAQNPSRYQTDGGMSVSDSSGGSKVYSTGSYLSGTWRSGGMTATGVSPNMVVHYRSADSILRTLSEARGRFASESEYVEYLRALVTRFLHMKERYAADAQSLKVIDYIIGGLLRLQGGMMDFRTDTSPADPDTSGGMKFKDENKLNY